MAAVEVVAQHGWGFGAWCWDGWRGIMPEGFSLHCPDRGYFGDAVADAPSAPDMVIAHSLGLHLVPPALFDAAQSVVVLGGFRHFHSDRENHARRSRRTVERMCARLGQEPEALLRDFYTRCGADVDLPRGPLAIPLLGDDLKLLQDGAMELAPLLKKDRILVLHGDGDRVVPPERAAELNALLPGSAFELIAGAGHALPMTHMRACWELIEEDWRLRCGA